MIPGDHDLLQQIANDVKHLVKGFDEHVKKDEVDFNKVKGRIFWLTIAMVVVAMIIGGPELVASFIKP